MEDYKSVSRLINENDVKHERFGSYTIKMRNYASSILNITRDKN